MLKNIGFITLFFLVITDMSGQKRIEKTWDASAFDQIEINSDEVFLVRIVSEDTEFIRVRMTSEGEFSEQLLIQSSEINRTLSLTHGFTPFFVAKNDKLAAHKVISVAIEVVVPARMKVLVTGAIVSVETVGTFHHIELDLEEGNCFLKQFKGNARLRTRNGNITVVAADAIARDVKSKNGIVKNELPKRGTTTITAESVNGDITLIQSQK